MKNISIDGRLVGSGQPVFVVAEISANHGGRLTRAIRLIHEAKNAGADAVKFQTYTPDTMTLDVQRKMFIVGKGTPWSGRSLYSLYREAHTPWGWHKHLQKAARAIGLPFFSTPFDPGTVELLETLKVPVYKIASFELVDTQLLKKVAQTGKPVILSTGMAVAKEIKDAVNTLRKNGCRKLILLKCTSAYPALPEEMNLRSIPTLAHDFNVPVGLSDHTMGIAVPVAAVALGACLIEKHLTLSRQIPGPDSSFSLEPVEFKAMVDAVRSVEKALGVGGYVRGKEEIKNRVFRRSLFAVNDIKSGELFTDKNVRSIRPGYGLPPRFYYDVVGKSAELDIKRGTPLDWTMIKRRWRAG